MRDRIADMLGREALIRENAGTGNARQRAILLRVMERHTRNMEPRWAGPDTQAWTRDGREKT